MVIDFCFLVVAFIISAILGKVCIPVLKKLKVGQNERKEGPRSHLRKQGTPTMGGIMMIITLVLVTLVYVIGFIKDLDASKPIIALLLAAVGFGIVGFVDDYKKVVLKNTDGLNPKLKMFGLLIISVLYTVFLIKFTSIGTGIIVPFINYELILPIWLFIPFTIVVMLATTNAINLTDGVDGLAGSVTTIITLAMKKKNDGKDEDVILPKKNIEVVEYSRNYKK
jgi:phospho-N-acetylmuramoyl-pentapeptide-transferase